MDWQLAITRNREALLTIVIALMQSLGLVKGGTLSTLPFHLYRKALLILRPAEAALRRLIIIAAHEMMMRGFKFARRGRRKNETYSALFGNGARNGTEGGAPISTLVGEMPGRAEGGEKTVSFRLIEPLKTFETELPDFSSFGAFTNNPAIGARIPAAALGRRLIALQQALDTIEKQAKRLARWYATRDAAIKQNHPHRLSPMRPGLPPGYRQRPSREVETILNECHGLAHYSYERRDSS